MAMTAPLDRTTTIDLFEPAPVGVSVNAVAAVAIALLIVVSFVAFGAGAGANDPLVPASPDSAVDDAIEIYVVQPGDTLWHIAGRLTSDGDDVRPVIDHLKEVAGGADLEVGQRIIIDHAAIRG